MSAVEEGRPERAVEAQRPGNSKERGWCGGERDSVEVTTDSLERERGREGKREEQVKRGRERVKRKRRRKEGGREREREGRKRRRRAKEGERERSEVDP
jgi:hypothetical protein